MHFIPIPTTKENLQKTEPLWLPFVDGLAKSLGETIDDLVARIRNEAMQIGLVWNEDEKHAYALLGWQLRMQGMVLVAEVLWLEGEQHEKWEHLLPEVEEYLTKHLCVNMIRMVHRPGWSRNLKKQGYKLTHYVMEKHYV
jgi:hypothetical protein